MGTSKSERKKNLELKFQLTTNFNLSILSITINKQTTMFFVNRQPRMRTVFDGIDSFDPFTDLVNFVECQPRLSDTERKHRAMKREIDELTSKEDYVKHRTNSLKQELENLNHFQDKTNKRREQALKQLDELEKQMKEERSAKRAKQSNDETKKSTGEDQSKKSSDHGKKEGPFHRSFNLFNRRSFASDPDAKAQTQHRSESKTFQTLPVRSADGKEETSRKLTPEGSDDEAKQLEHFEKSWKGEGEGLRLEDQSKATNSDTKENK